MKFDTEQFEPRGRLGYWYPKGKLRPVYKQSNCANCGRLCLIKSDAQEGFCTKSCSKKGERNPQWRGVEASYASLHERIYRARGKADHCIWGCEHDTYDWANITGAYDDVWDYVQMCRRCHNSYDRAIDMMLSSRVYWYPALKRTSSKPPPPR